MDLIDLEQAVQELAGKIIVKRRDNEAQQRAQQAAIDKNEGKEIFTRFSIRVPFSETISRLREKVKVRRRDLAKMLNKDKEVIETALSDPKVCLVKFHLFRTGLSILRFEKLIFAITSEISEIPMEHIIGY